MRKMNMRSSRPVVVAAVRCSACAWFAWTAACGSRPASGAATAATAEGQAGAHEVAAGARAAVGAGHSGNDAGKGGIAAVAAAVSGAGAAAAAATSLAGANAQAAGAPASAGAAGGGMAGTSAAGAMAGAAPSTAGAAGAPAVDTPATCPATAKLKAGQSSGSVQSGKYTRKYLVYAPASYDGTKPVPVVFDFHGYSSSPQGQMGASGFRALADREGFLAVYPEGIGASWNVNGCCGQAGDEQLDEIAFVRAIVDQVKQDACVDPRRFYATGISQGGGMAHHVACLAADLFAASAPVSSDLRTDPCVPARPISEISFRGEADSLDAYEGGHVGPPGMAGYTAIGAKATLERWKTIDMCTGSTTTMDQYCETYTACAAGVEVSLCSVPGADHVLYQNPVNLSVPKIAWELFKNHPL